MRPQSEFDAAECLWQKLFQAARISVFLPVSGSGQFPPIVAARSTQLRRRHTSARVFLNHHERRQIKSLCGLSLAFCKKMLRSFADGSANAIAREPKVNSEFDASLVWDEPVDDNVLTEQGQEVERLMQMPNAFANARLHAQNEMQRLISVCNRVAWRSVPADLRAPTPEEKTALLERLSTEDREKLMNESRIAARQRLLIARLEEAHEQYLAQLQAEPEDRDQFDASLVLDEPIGIEIADEQTRMVALLLQTPAAFANARQQAESDLQRYIEACNHLIWREVPADLRAPGEEEKAALLERLGAEDRERLMRDSRLAAKQRSLLHVMHEKHDEHLAQLQAEQCLLAEREALAREWAEFEAYDAAGKENRFAEWRASRAGVD
jgi:hypothetical protein